MQLRLWWLAAFVGICVKAQAPVDGVDVTSAGRYKWTEGSTAVSWDPPSYGVVGFRVDVAPLDYINNFTTASDLQDFVVSPARTQHSIAVTNGALAITYSGQSWQEASLSGRGFSPYAFRRVPDGAHVELTSIDCSARPAGATTALCGVVVYNAGSNTPLFTWMVGYSATFGGNVVIYHAYATTTVFRTADRGAAWSLTGTQLRVERNPTLTTQPYTLYARVNTSMPWNTVASKVNVMTSHLDTFDQGDLWMGLGAKAANGTTTATAVARFSGFRLTMPVPTTLPRTYTGAVDVCMATANITARSFYTYNATATNLTVSGLSSNFPYTVKVYALLSRSPETLSPPSPPIEGTYFWARKMPPRQQRISAWYSARYLTAGSLTSWPDASGNLHTLRQTSATTSLRPTVIRTTGYGSDFIQPGYVRFTRSAGTFMTGGSDSIDLGVTGPLTVYLVSRNRLASLQVIAGRGAAATNWDTTPGGWLYGITTNINDISGQGWLGMRVVTNDGQTAGGSTRNVIRPTTDTYQTVSYAITTVGPTDTNISANFSATYMPHIVPPVVSSSGIPRYSILGCQDGPCIVNTFPYWDSAANNTFNGSVSVQWNSTSNVASPTINNNLVFRVGGVPVTTGNPIYSFEGDMYELVLYREAHTTAQRTAIAAWLKNWVEDDFCPRDITNPTITSQTLVCKTGWLMSNCYHDCASGHTQYLGSTRDHFCTNGAWTPPPLVCARMCNDVAAPLYSATCTRRWLSEDFNSTNRPWMMTRYIVLPAMPEYQRNRVWFWDKDNQTLLANTQEVDPCDRMTGAASSLTTSNSRWNTFIPGSNGLQQTTTADIMLMDGNSTVGLVTRMMDQNNLYRMEMSSTRLSIVRVFGGVSAIIGTKVNMTFNPGTWYTLSFNSKLRNHWITMGNTTLLYATDNNNYQTWGAPGMYIGSRSLAVFDNFIADSDCDTGMNARNMFEGMQILMTCMDGYKQIGNTTWNCDGPASQYRGANLLCLSKPPTPVIGNLSVPELSKNGTLVGQVLALPANNQQVISYMLVSQFPRANGTSAFTISGCSGAVRVNDPSQLDFWALSALGKPEIILTIFAWPDTQTVAGVYWNVTIQVENVPTPPFLGDLNIAVNATYYGPMVVPWPLTNRNHYPLAWSVIAGDTSPPTFALDPTRGNMTLLPPGITWTPSTSVRSLYIRVGADSIVSDTPLESTATLTITVNDVNVRPVWPGAPIFTIREDIAVDNAFAGMLLATDPNSNNVDAPDGWTNLTYSIVGNANWHGVNNIFSVTSDGNLYIKTNFTFDPVSDYEWFNGRKARRVFPLLVSACDQGGQGWPALCANVTARIAVMAINDTFLLSFIDNMPSPVAPMSTQGGEIMRFTGNDFGVGSTMVVSYTSADLSLRYFASGCMVRSDNLAECRSVPGYGNNLRVSVIMDGALVNSSTPLFVSYAAPVVDSVVVSNPAGLTTAGSAEGAITISGSNFGPPGTPVTIAFGQLLEWSMRVLNNNYTQAVTHTAIKATLGEGCGASLPVRVTVGSQTSTCSDLSGVACTVSYPAPTLSIASASTASFNITSLSTLGGQRVYLSGSNLGPLRNAPLRGGALMTIPVAYTDGTRIFQYTTSCLKLTASPHTVLDCTTVPGVGRGLRFSANVCGQVSTAGPLSGASYAPPVLRDVIGPGTSRASTEGGQLVTLRLDEAGPVNNIASVPQSVTAVRYGTPGIYQYTAQSCYVSFAATTGSEITCFTAPGTGAGHYWYVTVGFQDSSVLAKNSSYGAPILSFFTGVGAQNADTRAGEAYPVTINGFNMGADMSLVSVSYINLLTGKRASDGLVPTTLGRPTGVNYYVPISCTFTTPHRALSCIMPPSAGTFIQWNLVVDGQVSTAPTTSFSPPIISSVVLVDGGTVVTTDGGAIVEINGTDFGLAHLVQAVRFGPTGNEYAVQSWQYVDHTSLYAVLGPGIGKDGLAFTVTVADQVSAPFHSGLSYDTPKIDIVLPLAIPTEQDPIRPTLVTVYGREFALLNPDVTTEVAFGNPSDGAVLRLPVLSRSPTLSQVLSPGFTPGPSPVNQSITFAAPSGIGAGRAIRIIQYLRGQQFSDAQVALLPLQGAAATVDYMAPAIDFVFVYRLTIFENTTLLSTLLSNSTGVSMAEARRLEIRGAQFGTPPGSDSVVRKIQVRPQGAPEDYWLDGLAAFVPTNWTSNRIDAYVLGNKASIRVVVGSKNFDGTVTFNQTSAPYEYSDVSPVVNGLIGANNYLTAGGEVITLQASGLSSTLELNVTVGVSPMMSQCTLLAIDGFTKIDNAGQAAAMLSAQSGGSLLNDFIYTIKCLVPPGQGKNVPVLVWRNGLPSGTATSSSNVINYFAPVVTATGVYNSLSGFYDMNNFPATPAVRPSTDGGMRIKLQGTNFGICPTVTIFHRADVATLTEISACLDAYDANNKKVKVPNPEVLATHTSIEFLAPEGEGTGVSYGPSGWTITLSAGEGIYRQQDDRIVQLRYQPPAVDAISTPIPVDTRGGVPLTIIGRNFGYLSVPTVSLSSVFRSSIPCTNVVRYSHFNLSCIVASGSGSQLSIRIRVADLTGTGGSFNYTPPDIQAITLIPYTSVTPSVLADLRNGTWMNSTESNTTSIFAPTVALGSSGPQLLASPHGGDVVVIDGMSLGAFDPVNNCPFVAWAPSWGSLIASDITIAAGSAPIGIPTCDGMETFLGEGEIHAGTGILWYNHTRVAFILPPGAGARSVLIRAGGQLPPTPARYHNLAYAGPSILMLRGRGQLSTNGGDPLDIFGLNFAPPTLNGPRNITSRQVDFPLVLPLPEDSMPPSEQLRIEFGRSTSLMPCVSTAYAASGAIAPGCGNCLQNGVTSIKLAEDHPAAPDQIVMTVPAGVGKNKPVYVTYIAVDGSVLTRSEVARFSYDAPVITSLYPDLILDDGLASLSLYLRGRNFGRLQDMPLMDLSEQGVEVILGNNTECADAQRVMKNFEDLVQCRVGGDVARLTVGFMNFTINIAGQSGFLGAESRSTLLVGCQKDYFGHFGEFCMPCPLGAKCKGFVNDESLGETITSGGVHTGSGPYTGLNVSEIPITIGNVEVARRGYHTYPIPIPAFFDLNGTMSDACPELVRRQYTNEDGTFRDVCIVGCVPEEACLGANHCDEAYTSNPPYYRCADCNKGYYRSSGDCIKCPDSPVALVLGIIFVLGFVAGSGYLLNKYQFDIRIISIGIDYFQVLAIFSQSKVQWPPEVKQLYRLLSAFNLNIEIVAPECFVPNMSYVQKFAAILAMPYAVLTIFLVYNTSRFLFYRFVYGQRDIKEHLRNAAASVSIALMLMFLFYLFTARTLLGIWECAPAKPDDGKRYLQVGTFEECGKPGGVQMRLIPWSIVGVIVLVAGYPLSITFALYKNRFEVMSDQLLRALRREPPLRSETALVRSALARVYYQFKPSFAYWWILVIITRKFMIAFSSLVFSQNSSYQLSFCVLILVCAFAAQMRYMPYMPQADFDDVVRDVAERAKTDQFWANLKSQAISVDMLSKKRTVANSMSRSVGDAYQALTWVGRTLCNYNTIEGILLFDASMVCLMGVLYSTVRPTDGYFESSRKSVTNVLMLLIIVGIIYFTSVFVADILQQYNAKRVARADAVSAAGKAAKTKARLSMKEPTGFDILHGPKAFESSTTTNPLFFRADGAANEDRLAQTVRQMAEPPGQELWDVIREHFASLNTQVGEMSTQLGQSRQEIQRLIDIIKEGGLADRLLGGAAGVGGGTPNPMRARTGKTARKSFAATLTGVEDSPTGSEDGPDARGRAGSVLRGRTDSVLSRGRTDSVLSRGRNDSVTSRERADSIAGRSSADSFARDRTDSITSPSPASDAGPTPPVVAAAAVAPAALPAPATPTAAVPAVPRVASGNAAALAHFKRNVGTGPRLSALDKKRSLRFHDE